LAAPPAATPTGPPARTFSNVTAATLACVADRSRKQHGTVYTPDAKNPNIVTSETRYFGLTRILYAFDPSARAVTYTILQKPGLASYSQVWDGIRDAIKACS
jgi:hypothetical protein